MFTRLSLYASQIHMQWEKIKGKIVTSNIKREAPPMQNRPQIASSCTAWHWRR